MDDVSGNSDSDTELHLAVRYGELSEVLEALQQGFDPNKIGIYQWSPLHEACSEGHVDMVKALLKHGGDPELQDKLFGDTSLHHAVKNDHSVVLKLLLEHAGNMSISNNNNQKVSDIIHGDCMKIIDHYRIQKLMKLSLSQARQEVKDHNCSYIKHTEGICHNNGLSSLDPSLDSFLKEPIMRQKAWSPIVTSSSKGVLGELQLTFEYNSKKKYLKIRLWKLDGLMLAPAFSSGIKTLYIKSRFIPDESGTSKRRSSEIRVSPLLEQIIHQKPTQAYLTENGHEELFHPVSHTYTETLVYEGITPNMISSKSVHIQLCMRQKYTQKSYALSDITLPLAAAITKIVRDVYVLRKNALTKFADNMTVLKYDKMTQNSSSDPNLRADLGSSLSVSSGFNRAVSERNMTVMRVCSESVISSSPEISINIPSDEEETTLNSDQLEKSSSRPSSTPVENTMFKRIQTSHTAKIPVREITRTHQRCEVIAHRSDVSSQKNQLPEPNENLQTSINLPGNISEEESFELRCLSPPTISHHSIDMDSLESSTNSDTIIHIPSHLEPAHDKSSRTSKLKRMFNKHKTSFNQLTSPIENHVTLNIPRTVMLNLQESATNPTFAGSRERNDELKSEVVVSVGDLELEDMEGDRGMLRDSGIPSSAELKV